MRLRAMTHSPRSTQHLALRVMTYNVHGCRGIDGIISPHRIAEVIAAAKPDIAALQELDVGRPRSGGLDQAESIAQYLGMDVHFSPAMRVLEEQYGDAILTRWPSRLVKAAALPMPRSLWPLEPRGALWSEISIRGVPVQMLTTHLGLRSRERRMQADTLAGAEWLSHPDCKAPIVLAGDFNFRSRSRAYATIAARLTDAHAAISPQPTFPSRFPRLRLDYVFASSAIGITGAECIRNALTRVASDHLPVVVDLLVPLTETIMADRTEHA